jgi:hypothetical protein
MDVMADPVPSAESAPLNPRTPIGHVTVLVYEMRPGQVEVQVRFPDEAMAAGSGAAAKRQEFSGLVMSELKNSLPTLSE